jgi:hypothetical protein
MAPNERELLARARRVYEWSRLRAALPWALWVAPMIAATLAIGGPSTTMRLGAGVALAVLVVILAWRGGAARRAIGPGLLAGLAPLALPLITRSMHLCGVHGCMMLCLPACIVGGVVGGLVVALTLRRVTEGRVTFALATAAIAMLCGAMGCLIAGLGGFLGMVVAVATLPVPVLLGVGGGNRA